MVFDAHDFVLSVMIDIDYGRFTTSTDLLHQGQHQLPLHVVKAKTGFVQYQQGRVLDHGPRDQH